MAKTWHPQKAKIGARLRNHVHCAIDACKGDGLNVTMYVTAKETWAKRLTKRKPKSLWMKDMKDGEPSIDNSDICGNCDELSDSE